MTRVKLCGLRNVNDVLAAQNAKADYIGFVLAKSKRQVTDKEVVTAIEPLDRSKSVGPKPVLVLVDETVEKIVSLCKTTGVLHVQLCGREAPATCSLLREKYGLTVWKAWGVRGTEEDQMLAHYVGHVDAILLDTYKAGSHGGTGHFFDWQQIPRLQVLLPETPLVIAGGLSPHTVGSVVAKYHPFAVDVSSGIETDEQKDPDKMREFVNAARSGLDVS
ncbi:phosphoribosylanthranilate isomerase [Sulfoacidibacillus thermotolerans]|uniref:N-(5'-phosphoribosyl)anthranilate isomerase n=1 Tax=Sulfoacidibacillus thermotolerans TaxID=1765684 RepID=A0A2U3D702_SULT2|nr:phosphoribosylanthranilate isomerase [Sulfoacidibacillus thermotolerans]PWI57057.1 hypothetical protein BM613_10410 [Sulfoacidibacillus thermotolerans]